MKRIEHLNVGLPALKSTRRILNTKILLVLVFGMLIQVFSMDLKAQTVSLTGTVTSSEGETIPGVTVYVKGTTLGATTNLEGVYSLENIPADAVLVFSYVGMLPEEIEVGDQTAIDIALVPDLIGLEEVVVVGYGSMAKADLTGAVSTIKNEDLVKTAAPNLTSTLTGRLTGVVSRQTSGRPGGDLPEFTIRGKSTIDPNNDDGINPNEPLVLVDGVEREFARIDPNEIESITVLKDAASAAIYGTRGANGVILVTTKRGVEGKTSVNYNFSYTLSEPTFMPEYFNAGDYTYYLNEAAINSGETAPYTDEQVEAYRSGSLPSTDWWGEMMNDYAPMSQHSLTASGGSEKITYFLSLGYIDQKGLYDRANYKRYNVRSNIDAKINDQLSVNLSMAARSQHHESGQVSEEKLYQTLRTAIPTTPAYVPEELREDYDKLGLNFNGTAGSPIGEANYSGYKRDRYNFLENKLGVKYVFPFVKGLSATFDYAYDKKYTSEKDWTDSYWLNNYTPATGNSSTVPSNSLLSLWQKEIEETKSTLQAALKFDRSIGLHKINTIFVFEQKESVGQYLQGSGDGFNGNSIQYLFAADAETKKNDSKPVDNQVASTSYIGRINYNYNEKYLLNISGRADGSSKFVKEKWGFFPAFSAGWRISKEPFMENIAVLNNLKLRGGMGMFGNDRIPHGITVGGYDISYGMVMGSAYYSGIRPSNEPNPYATWETATNYNIGLDYGLFNSKITGEIEVYKGRTTDILMFANKTVPDTYGKDLPMENLGITENSGVEAIIRYNNNAGDFKYTISGNFTYATNKVIENGESADVLVPEKGRPFDIRIGYQSDGLFQSVEEIENSPYVALVNGNVQPGDIKYKDQDGNDTINELDKVWFGNSQDPKMVFGLNFSGSYKNFGISMNFQGATMYDRYNYLIAFEKNYNTYAVLEDSWREGNEDAKYPRLEKARSANNELYSDYWMTPGFYIKLRSLDLSYSISNKTFLSAVGIQNLTLSLSGRNLFTIAKKDGFDPEGTDNKYPIMRTYSFGVNVTF